LVTTVVIPITEMSYPSSWRMRTPAFSYICTYIRIKRKSWIDVGCDRLLFHIHSSICLMLGCHWSSRVWSIVQNCKNCWWSWA
jgi:hypothetical protein